MFLGRAWVMALAAEGEQGIVDLVQAMGNEIRTGMALMGVRSLDEMERASSHCGNRAHASPASPSRTVS